MKFYTKLFLILVTILGVFACSKSNNTPISKPSQVNHPKDILRVGNGTEPPTLDPQKAADDSSSRIDYDLFENLLDFDQADKPIAGMAESWVISPDKKHYVFYLRKDLKFSDGTPITSKDFLYTWQRIVDPKTATERATTLNNVLNARDIMKGKMDKSNLGVSAPDPYTFEVTLARPDPTLLYAASSWDLAVVSQKNIQKYGDKWTEPNNMVTSGPYILKEHINNGKITLVKNQYYYDKDKVKIPQIEFYPIENQNAEISQYKSGALDLTMTLPIDQYSQLKQELGSEIITEPMAGSYFYEFNLRRPELKNIKLRQALSMAIDRKILTTKIINQGQTPLYSIIIPTLTNGAFAPVKYDWSTWLCNDVKSTTKLFIMTT